MSSPAVPDPYVALGVPKDAPAQTIKATYRKLALKYHPDKVTDDSLKASAADNFHRIQQAYEIIGDEDRRGRYDAQVKLAELRRDVLERQAHSSRTDVRTAAFEVPLSTPGKAAFTARGPERRTEERRPSGAYEAYEDDDYFNPRSASRKNPEYERESRNKYSTKVDTDRIRPSPYARELPREKESVKAARSDKRRAGDKDRRRDRETKYRPVVEDDSDDSDLSDYTRYSRRATESKRDPYYAKRTKDQSVYDSEESETRTKMKSQREVSLEYRRAKGERIGGDVRPTVNRAYTSRGAYDADQMERDRSATSPTAGARRSSARPASSGHDRRRDRNDRDRKNSAPDVTYASSRRPATLEKHNSSPADIRIPPNPYRSPTAGARYEDSEFSPPPTMKRSETMPVQSSSSSRRKDATPHVSSRLRQTDINQGLPTPSVTPEYTSPTEQYPTLNKYRTAEESERRTRRTELREPEPSPRENRRMTRSPSPVAAPERSERKTRSSSNRHPPAQLPPLRTGSSYNVGSFPESPVETPLRSARPFPVGHRGDLYGEVPTTRRAYNYSERDRDRERDDYRMSPAAETVRYTKNVSPDEVKMAAGGYRINRHREKPVLTRAQTYAF